MTNKQDAKEKLKEKLAAKSPLDPITLIRLDSLRTQLLRLHKILLDDERVAYEKVHGPVGNVNRVLSLVMSDPWFNWLHEISRLIVRIDELQDAADGTEDQAGKLFSESKNLILTKGGDTEFAVAYRVALQRSSAAVGQHAEVLKVVHDD